MDDIRSAQERLELAERRLAALQDEGLDTAGLTSQLGFARRALEDGQASNVLILCEEILNTAQRLATQGSGQDPRPSRPVKSDRFQKIKSQTTDYAKPVEAAPATPSAPGPAVVEPPTSSTDTPSGRLPVVVHHDDQRLDPRIDPRIAAAAGFPEIPTDVGSAAAATAMPTPQIALDAAALTEEIRKQVVKTASETQPKTITTSQIREFIVKSVQKALGEHFADHQAEQSRTDGRISAALAEQIQPTLAALSERLERIAAHPSAPPAWDEAKLTTLMERLVGPLLSDLEHRLEVRLMPLPPIDPTPAVQAAISPLNARLDRIDAAIAGIAAAPAPAPAPVSVPVVDPTPMIQAAMAPLGDQISRLDQSLAPIAQRLDGLETVARDHQLQLLNAAAQALRAEQAALAVRGMDIQAVVASAVQNSLASLHEDLAKKLAPSAVVPADQLNALKEELARDMRADMDWQVEAMAAEKGWITLGDMKSEVSRFQGSGGAQASQQAGFARLEGALVEFVNQTQQQQAKFLELLSREVEQRTSIITSQALSEVHPRRPIQVSEHAGGNEDPFLSGDEAHPSDHTGTLVTARAVQPVTASLAKDNNDVSLDALSISSMQRAINDRTDTTPAAVASTRSYAAPDQVPVDLQSPTRAIAHPAGSGAMINEHVTTAFLEAIQEQSLDTDVMAEMAPIQDPAQAGETSAASRMPIMEIRALAKEPASVPEAEPGHGSGVMSDVFLSAETVSIHAASTVRTEAQQRTGETGVHASGQRETGHHETGHQEATASDAMAPATRAHVPLTMRQRSKPAAEPQGFEAALRTLVDDEVRRRVPETVGAAVQAAISQALAAQEARFREELNARMAEIPPAPAAGDPASAVAALAEALGRSGVSSGGGHGGLNDLVTQLKSPAARQAILAVVATEAVENPSALAELTGLRAFLRREVEQATEAAARRPIDGALISDSL